MLRTSKAHWVSRAIKINGDRFDYSKSIYLGSKKPLSISCSSCGYEFVRRADSHVSREDSCPWCSGGKEKITPEVFKKRLGMVHGDKYSFELSDYSGIRKKLKIICNVCKGWCEKRCDFMVRADTLIYRGSGCPRCYLKNRGFKMEALFGEVLYSIYPNQTFIKTRPKFLLHPETGRNLELDFYSEELGIAFEVNGRQHYEFVEYFHGDKEGFKYSLKKDLFKKRACEENGVKLYSFDLRKLIGSSSDSKEVMFKFIANI
jgi:hypothetical protein